MCVEVRVGGCVHAHVCVCVCVCLERVNKVLESVRVRGCEWIEVSPIKGMSEHLLPNVILHSLLASVARVIRL